MFWTPSEAGRLINSENDATYLTRLSFTCGTDCDNVSIFLLLSGATLGTRVGVFLVSSWRYGVNQVSLRSTLSGAPLCEIRCTRYFQFGGIVTPLMNETVEIHHQTPHEIEMRHYPFLGLETELLILYEIVSVQYTSLHVRRVTNWLFHINFIEIFHSIHKLDSPICGNF